jgi:hypothetical protein
MTTCGAVTKPHRSATTVPPAPVEVVHLHASPGFNLNR